MNQTATELFSPVVNLASATLTPIVGAARYLSAVRAFLVEMPTHLESYKTRGLFGDNEVKLLGHSWKMPGKSIETHEGHDRRHRFLQNETRHLALSNQGLVVVSEMQTISSKGDTPLPPTLTVIGPPTTRDILKVARYATYEDVKQSAISEISIRNQVRRTGIN